jgi:hypothetical protein
LAAAVCSGQIVVVDPTTNAPLAEELLLPDVPVNDYEQKVVAVENTGGGPVTIESATATGLGFSLCCLSSFTLAPQQSQTLTLQFAPTGTGNFTGALQIDSFTIFLYATSIPAASLFVQTSAGLNQAHEGTPLVLTLNSAFTGQLPCMLRNDTTGPVIVNSLAASGDWAMVSPPALPLTLQAGGQAAFALAATAPLQGGLEGVVSVDQWSYAIQAQPVMPAIQLSASSSTLQSGEQATLSIAFSSAPATTTAGTVELTFASSTSVALTDPAILFTSSGTTSAGFTSTAGQTAASFGGQTSLTFQTGTTAGTLHVHASWGSSADDLDIALAAAPIAIDTVTAQRQSGALQIVVTGFDNTRTAGQMNFSFFDSTGAFIGNPVFADFTQSFYNYFFDTAYNSGGMFKMTTVFPVTGNTGQVNAVQMNLMNSAGDAQTGVIKFQ